MTNVVPFNTSKKKQPRKGVATTSAVSPQDMFSEMLERDIRNVMEATGLDYEGAIEMVRDFYVRYPALVEYVRDQNNLLRR